MSPETAGLASVASSSREIVGEHAYSQAGPTGLNLEREGRNAIGITKPPKWLKGQSNSVKSSNQSITYRKNPMVPLAGIYPRIKLLFLLFFFCSNVRFVSQ
ncbi:hypothetical protein EOB59_01335 [Mesorhizobium sp. M7A.F.Ca.MR.176.00.0.0]|uniref:hypothetical protein n=1 Tax=Mesorhizobium sp. M7A.F.Ca.MR.176.00.0.0 TaxID=2496776 RepID=UPI000FD1B5C4|nr:hypothetical protein [Mesorhizobium sp. M7A.F.Ca.MR.176.00.0.0]RUU93792.1 hypothetical protein EOB59_01335 [Mesorhizobium sp. M7A.F.Ca.MR.176.00.0.0]